MQDLRSSFPIFATHPDLVYLDSAAMALKPGSVVDAMGQYYTTYSANIHRGLYPIALQALEMYERTRATVATLLHAASPSAIVFTKGTTESINMVVQGLRDTIGGGDEIVVTILDHHSNFVPWQQLAIRNKAVFTVLTELTIERMGEYISRNTKVFAFPLMSNVTGEVLDAKALIAAARVINPDILILVDAAQAVSHIPLDVQDMDCDFLVFSGHKLYGPTGVGVLYGKRGALEMLIPYQYGGEMIHEVQVERTTYKDIPYRFEAGTPPIGEVIGLHHAVTFISDIGYPQIAQHDRDLDTHTRSSLTTYFGDKVRIIEPIFGRQGHSLLAFTIAGVHPHDIADLLGHSQVCIRAGHHCAQPLHQTLGLSASCRISFGLYNTRKDIDICMSKLVAIIDSFS